MTGLREKRKAAGKKQREIAEVLGVKLHTYQQYEYGNREPNLDVLKKMRDIFKCTIDELL